jgi:DNA-binding transcriptional ArsR family regulator
MPATIPVQLAEVAQLIADCGRANILSTLMDGRALTAGELASIAGVTPQTMSSHLSKLVKRELLAVEKRGRQRFYRLASPQIAQMLASMMLVARSAAPS